GGLLIVGLRFLPGLLPELFGLAGVGVARPLPRALGRRPSGGVSPPGSGHRNQGGTALLPRPLRPSHAPVSAYNLPRPFRGPRLSPCPSLATLADCDLLVLHGVCAGDADSLKILEAYLDRRLGPDWRNARKPPPRGPRTDMTREEALAVLGLGEGAGDDDIRAAHRRLIQRMHPDVGGSADLAARINRAKDVLLGG